MRSRGIAKSSIGSEPFVSLHLFRCKSFFNDIMAARSAQVFLNALGKPVFSFYMQLENLIFSAVCISFVNSQLFAKRIRYCTPDDKRKKACKQSLGRFPRSINVLIGYVKPKEIELHAFCFEKWSSYYKVRERERWRLQLAEKSAVRVKKANIRIHAVY